MKVIYYSDDGQKFETKEECLRYEANKQKWLNGIHAFDDEEEELVINGDRIFEILHDTIYVTFDSQDARELFVSEQNLYGHISISETIKYRDGDVFVYDEDADEWISAMRMVEYYQGIIDKFTTERK